MLARASAVSSQSPHQTRWMRLQSKIGFVRQAHFLNHIFGLSPHAPVPPLLSSPLSPPLLPSPLLPCAPVSVFVERERRRLARRSLWLWFHPRKNLRWANAEGPPVCEYMARATEATMLMARAAATMTMRWLCGKDKWISFSGGRGWQCWWSQAGNSEMISIRWEGEESFAPF